MRIQYAPQFLAKLKKVDVRVANSFREQLELFIKDPLHPQLDNHLLTDVYQGYRSIDVTADYRAIYEEIDEGEEPIAYFTALGTHQELYGN